MSYYLQTIQYCVEQLKKRTTNVDCIDGLDKFFNDIQGKTDYDIIEGYLLILRIYNATYKNNNIDDILKVFV